MENALWQFFVNKDLIQLFKTGEVVWKSEEAQKLYHQYAALQLGIRPWEIPLIPPEDLNYFLRMKSLEGRAGEDSGWKKVG